MARRAYPKLILEDDHWDRIAIIEKHGLEGWWNKEGLADYADAASFLDMTQSNPAFPMGLFIAPASKRQCPYVIWKEEDGYAVGVFAGYT